MKNIKNKLVRAYAKMVLKRLGKVAITLKNNYIRQWYEEGEKTYGRLKMPKALHYALLYVYGNEISRLEINGVVFSETFENIKVNLYTARPGLIIGKMGSLIDNLEEVLTKVFGKQTEINLTETQRMLGIDYHHYGY